jgi:hypothetical protein
MYKIWFPGVESSGADRDRVNGVKLEGLGREPLSILGRCFPGKWRAAVLAALPKVWYRW